METGQITVVTDFLLQPDKRAVLESIECRESNPAYDSMSAAYDRVIELAKTALSVKAAYVYDKGRADFRLRELESCEAIVYCLLTAGEAISTRSEEYFQSGRYAEGLILDAIANVTVFDCSRQLYQKLVCEAQDSGLGLTGRFSPGDKDFPVCFQKTILERFPAGDRLGMLLTDGYMLKPAKSLAYVYGADRHLSAGPVDHNCSACGSINCKLRRPDSEQTVRLTVFGDRQRQVIAKTSETIMTALSGQGFGLRSPCGGQGRCGKCKIRVLSGRVASNTVNSNGIYLACLTYPVTDCEIAIDLPEQSYQAVSGFQANVLTPDSGFQVTAVDFTPSDWGGGASVTRQIADKQGVQHSYSLKALRKLADIQRKRAATNQSEPAGQINLVIHEGKVVDLLADAQRLYGLAIDIGTTTVVLSLVDLASGKIAETRSLLNSQRRYGADVISRIQYSAGANMESLRLCIRADILSAIGQFDAAAGSAIVHTAIAGNTTMLHFLLGLPAEALGRYPFQPVTTGLQELSFAELFADNTLDCLVTILPGISAFVGADIVAGLLQCGFAGSNEPAVLLDIGTNGEIAIGNKNRILCLSAAAGPVFEGAGISCGTGSVSGAIDSFSMTDGSPRYTTIGGADPVGVCGSGVIDIMAACVREGVVDTTGRFDQSRFPGAMLPVARTRQGDWLGFTQKDVRELQLAKAAIRSGLEVLIKAYGCGYEELDTVYVAGSFGTHLNIGSAVEIGLLPEALQPKVKAAGNTCLGGAVQYLVSQSSQQAIRRLLAVSGYLDLAADPSFNELLIEHMYFPRRPAAD